MINLVALPCLCVDVFDGIICFVLDGLYFFCLSYVQKNEQK